MTVIYLHGFASGPGSKKATLLRERFREQGIELCVPDLAEGDFEHLTITRQLALVERLAGGRAVSLIGSSMGGYLAALYAARHPGVERVVLLAPAFGFARRLPSFLTAEQFAAWERTGGHEFFHYGEGRPVRLHFGLIEDARRYEEFPEVTQPALILHGARDRDVPWELSARYAETRPNVRLVPLDDGHELADSLERVWLETRAFFDDPRFRRC